jgi:hypothetical protein
MKTGNRSTVLEFVVAGISLMIAVVTGTAWIGQPLRLVNLVTIIALSATAGVTFGQAVWRVRQERTKNQHGSTS